MPLLKRDTMWRLHPANLSPAKPKRKASRLFASGLTMDSVEPLARRVRQRAASLPPSQVRPFVFTELFVRVELEPRVNDLFEIVERWAPHVVIHDVAEFAAPLVATTAGIPYVEHSYGPAIQNDVIRAAGDATAPFWTSHGLAPHPLGGFYRYLYLDVCPPSLQLPEAVPGVVQSIRTVETQPLDTSPRGWVRCSGCRSSTSHWAPSTTTSSTCSARYSMDSATKG